MNKSPRATKATVYLRTPDAAERIGVSRATLERWRMTGYGPRYCKLSAKIVAYPVAELDRWCAAHTVASTSEPEPAA